MLWVGRKGQRAEGLILRLSRVVVLWGGRRRDPGFVVGYQFEKSEEKRCTNAQPAMRICPVD